MKKVLVILAGIMAIMVMTGCGKDTPKETTKSNVEEIKVEEIQVEEIQVENILVEEIETERIYIDGEYEAELNYNSKVNTWDNNNNVTYWD